MSVLALILRIYIGGLCSNLRNHQLVSHFDPFPLSPFFWPSRVAGRGKKLCGANTRARTIYIYLRRFLGDKLNWTAVSNVCCLPLRGILYIELPDHACSR